MRNFELHSNNEIIVCESLISTTDLIQKCLVQMRFDVSLLVKYMEGPKE